MALLPWKRSTIALRVYITIELIARSNTLPFVFAFLNIYYFKHNERAVYVDQKSRKCNAENQFCSRLLICSQSSVTSQKYLITVPVLHRNKLLWQILAICVYHSIFFLVWPLLPNHCMGKGFLFHLLALSTHSMTHTHTHAHAHTNTHTTVSRTLLDERSTRRRDLYLTTLNRQTYMSQAGFEPAIPASERP